MNAAISMYEKEFLKPVGIAAPRVLMPPSGENRVEYLERGEVARILLACQGWKWDAKEGRMVQETGGNKHAPARILKRSRRHHTSRLILMGVYTGTRHTAMINATWERTPDAPYVDVETGLYYRRGSDVVETSKRTPPCRIPDELRRHMRRWRRLDLEKGIKHVITYHSAPLKGRIRTSWEGVLEDAAITKEVNVHTLRHTCASWLVQSMPGSGLTWEEIADFMGMTVEILKKVYGHHDPDYQKDIGKGFKAHRESRKPNQLRTTAQVQEHSKLIP